MPSFSQSWADGQETTSYLKFGRDDGIRPLIIYREFHGAFPNYRELIEEFRLYHNLAEDKARNLLLTFDESGREIEVVRITPSSVQARLKQLRQFQAATGLYLAVYFDSTRFSTIPLTEVPAAEQELEVKDVLVRWLRVVRACEFKDGYNTFSRLCGKVVLAPPSRSKAGLGPYEDRDEREMLFIIGIDVDGNDVEYTSNPEMLGNNFGANSDAPHYLTPVFFRREVLAKYYSEPERYSVSDGLLTCLGLWQCDIDNNLDSHVVVFLGDLGRDLPYDERLHWRQYNVPPEGTISQTYYRRSLMAEFAEAQSPDLIFRSTYRQVTSEWQSTQGWMLFLDPSPADAHLLATVRIPTTDSQVEFDEQLMNLAKLLVDSLNEQELAKRAVSLPENTKSIGKLDAFLNATGYPHRQPLIELLRSLQNLRSTGAAHRKGSKYQATMTKLGGTQAYKPAIIRDLIKDATAALIALRSYYCALPDS